MHAHTQTQPTIWELAYAAVFVLWVSIPVDILDWTKVNLVQSWPVKFSLCSSQLREQEKALACRKNEKWIGFMKGSKIKSQSYSTVMGRGLIWSFHGFPVPGSNLFWDLGPQDFKISNFFEVVSIRLFLFLLLSPTNFVVFLPHSLMNSTSGSLSLFNYHSWKHQRPHTWPISLKPWILSCWCLSLEQSCILVISVNYSYLHILDLALTNDCTTYEILISNIPLPISFYPFS